MSRQNPKQASFAAKTPSYLKTHYLSLSLLLAGYGALYLSSVVLGGWTISDWGKDVTEYPIAQITPLLPRGFIDPIFFATSFPALIIGTVVLCMYSIRGIRPEIASHKEQVAILLTAFGFTYQVMGAWPLGTIANFPWEWQKQIMRNGPAFAWALFSLSLAALIIGGASLFIHSRIWHQKHPEISRAN
jgi:hypothetical protein